ncbi:unnamed protein product [Adineta ricciae]|uniref:RBR-type E3 ubiquitin transferase n=1 Tax=Adineta ricciae TaxID=249248 RepID=A0A815L911_ADIRI|nr:unnamed protein product [Adineta ricciae]
MGENKQQQEEELLILKSILGDLVTDLGDENDRCEVDIEFQLPSPFLLRLIDNSNELCTQIQNLPPLILTVNFHDQYPSSTDSPTFVLSSCYLSRQYLATMCHKLDQIWEENPSQPIVYQWVECLKEHFLSLNELRLTTEEIDDENDEPRAMSSYESKQASAIYDQLIAHNREKENEKFLLEYHECPICTSNNIPGRDMIHLHKCHHAFCRQCLQEYAVLHINAGSVEWLLCPDAQCQLSMLPSEIKLMVKDDSLYEKYERLLLQKTFDQMLDIVWCPRCQIPVIAGGENDNLALCEQCRFPFCKKCKKTYHSESLCGRQLEMALLKDQRRKLRQSLQAHKLSVEESQELLKEFLAVAKIENTTRLCPNPLCRTPIEKNQGCDHMFCTRCQRHFNWSDAKDETAATKALFDDAGQNVDQILNLILREPTEEDLDSNDFESSALKVVSGLFLSRTKICPYEKCGKVHVKYGTNNYAMCQYCKRGFCFRCLRPLINDRTHFGRACKQYSD